MDYRRFGDKIVARIDKGEEIALELMKIVVKEEIGLAGVTAIGAVNRLTIGLFDTQRKEYMKTTLEGEFEVTSLIGNVSTMKGQPYLHLHINVGDDMNKTYGGHLNEAVVSGTCEMIIDVIQGSLDREFSDSIGLNLYKFE